MHHLKNLFYLTKKLLAVLAILAIVFIVFSLVFWAAYRSVDWSVWKPIKEAIEPFINFMKPVLDFYTDVYNSFTTQVNNL